jgi:hypothetical protein
MTDWPHWAGWRFLRCDGPTRVPLRACGGKTVSTSSCCSRRSALPARATCESNQPFHTESVFLWPKVRKKKWTVRSDHNWKVELWHPAVCNKLHVREHVKKKQWTKMCESKQPSHILVIKLFCGHKRIFVTTKIGITTIHVSQYMQYIYMYHKNREPVFLWPKVRKKSDQKCCPVGFRVYSDVCIYLSRVWFF